MYKIYGQETIPSIQQNDLVPFNAEIDEANSISVLTKSSRGETELVELGEMEDYDVINVEYDDGGSWMFTPEQYKEYVTISKSRGGDDFIIEPYLEGGSRGVGKIGERLIEFIKYKVLSKSVKLVARKLEEWTVMNQEGLFSVNANMDLLPLNLPSVTSETYLLMLHGTISNTTGTFGGLKVNGKFKEIHNKYAGRVIALEHKTLTKSVIENVQDLLEALPNNIRLDILSGSRGGLIGEVLNAMSEVPKPIWTEDMDDTIVVRLGITDLKKKLDAKKIKVNKIVRVACPAAGTSLLGNSISDFFQVFNNGTRILENGTYGKIFKGIKVLISVLLKQKDNPDALPGIYNMVPNSEFIQTLNTSEYFDTPVYVISGSIKKEGLKNSIKYLLTHWIYDQANDLIVDTISMKAGLRRNKIAEFYYKASITHFDYFDTFETQAAIGRALSASPDVFQVEGFEVQLIGAESRGLLNMGETPPNLSYDELGMKPIMVIIPGILGSTISYEGDLLWVKALKLMQGGIGKIDLLHDDPNKVTITGGVGDAYNKMVEHFKRDFDVIVFPFDWRKSIEDAGKLFIDEILKLEKKETRIHIVAHSMGGLVVRELMILKPELQKRLQNNGGKVLMLGTPWKGSYLIPQVFNANGKRFNQLRKLAFCSHKKKSLLQVIARFDGVYSLLPMYRENFEDLNLWTQFEQLKGDAVVPPNKSLTWFKNYKEKIEQKEADINYENLYYIAGFANDTVDRYEIENQKISFYADPNTLGDGSVTWDSGIPKMLAPKRVYYTLTEHGELCNDPALFDGIYDLITNGSTHDSNFTNRRENIQAEQSRGGLPNIQSSVYSNDPNIIIKDVLGLKEINPYYDDPAKTAISIQIVNGDLKYSTYPVMIGHFHKDSIIGAESVMDFLSENFLSQRNKLGAYPGPLGTSFILPSENTTTPGTVILGLGLKQEINPQRLQYAVEQATIEYLLHPETKGRKGISTLLVGSGYGNIVLSECINSIINGVVAANQRFAEVFPEGNQIQNLEIIELYKEKSEQAYEFIEENQKVYSKSNIRLNRKIDAVLGRRELSQYNKEKKWWKTINVKNAGIGDAYENSIEFTLSSDIAKVNQNVIKVDVSLVDRLFGKISTTTDWDDESIQAAFKLLIPNELRLMLNGNNSIVWVLDRFTAKYPWELLHFQAVQSQPTSIQAGMIRQLVYTNNNKPVTYVNSNSVCVIADPILDPKKAPEKLRLKQLPGAVTEGEMVLNAFKNKGYKEAKSLIGKTEREIFPALLLNRYKVLHFACHGVIEYGENKRTGIVIDYDSFLTPDILSNFDYMPDFIFVNCCYAGFIGEGDQNQFSPNIGTTLIEKGVKAAIVGAWEVNDAAANYFAEEFYRHFLNHEYFGEAVRKAREACFDKFRTVNTWGAYHCYGNQNYQLDNEGSGSDDVTLYNLRKDIMIDLEKLMNDTAISTKRSIENEKLRRKLNAMSTNIENSNLRNAQISEKEARIYAEIGDYESAINLYEKMLHEPSPDYTAWSAYFYHVIKCKHLVTRYDSENLKSPANKALLKEAYEILDETRKIYEKYTTKTNGIMYASVIKSHLMLVDEDNYAPRNDNDPKGYSDYFKMYLKILKDIYYHINVTFKNKRNYDDTHSLSLYIVVSSLISNNVSRIKTKITEDLGENLDIHMEDILDNIENQRKRNFWDEIKRINIMEAQLSLLKATETAKMNEIALSIRSIYREAWNFGGSRRNLLAEIDQLRFMLKAAKVTGAYAQDLVGTLEGLLNFYLKLETETFASK